MATKAKSGKIDETKRAMRRRSLVQARLKKDTFAHGQVESLSRKAGAFKTAPADVSGDVSRVGEQLTRQFDAFFATLKETPSDLAGIFDNFAGETFGAIQDRTPVDTGHARSGWQIENLSTSPNDRHFRITNSVPYVAYLEYGWSRQAPAGMVRVSLLEGEQRLKRATEAYAGR